MVSAVQSQLTNAQLTPARVASDVSYAIAAKSLDAQRQEGAAVLELLDGAAAQAQEGDSAAPAGGLGSLLDVTA